MSDFKLQRPAAYMELLQRFEECKKSVSSKVRAPIVIRPPYAFIEHYLKYSDKDVRILIIKCVVSYFILYLLSS